MTTDAGADDELANRSGMRLVVFTIGYEDHPEPESLVGALLNAEVEKLVDVRDLPLSRRRGFSKTALAEALEDAGVEYRHMRELGNPKVLRDYIGAASRPRASGATGLTSETAPPALSTNLLSSSRPRLSACCASRPITAPATAP